MVAARFFGRRLFSQKTVLVRSLKNSYQVLKLFSRSISIFDNSKTRWLLLTVPVGFKTFGPDDPQLRSSECLKNAVGLSVDSTSAVLSQSVFAIIKVEQQYTELIDALIKMMEYQLQVIDQENEYERLEDIILETRHEISNVRQKKQDLSLLFSSVEKLADASAEVAFASGSNYASISVSERHNSAQREVQRVQDLSLDADKRLMQAEAAFITHVSKHQERLKKKNERNPDGNFDEEVSMGKQDAL